MSIKFGQLVFYLLFNATITVLTHFESIAQLVLIRLVWSTMSIEDRYLNVGYKQWTCLQFLNQFSNREELWLENNSFALWMKYFRSVRVNMCFQPSVNQSLGQWSESRQCRSDSSHSRDNGFSSQLALSRSLFSIIFRAQQSQRQHCKHIYRLGSRVSRLSTMR